jgi:hypothetical protein
MAIETAVKIDVDVNGIQTVQQAATVYEDLGDAVAKTQREAEALALQFGINDKRTQDAIKVAGQYKQQLEQLDQAVDANRGNTQKLFGAIQGVAAGFEVAAGAMALFGGESKELDKVLVKVQGAMVFAQGLRDLKEFAPAIKAINSGFLNMIKTLKGVKLALAATGIGALVAVVGLFGEQIGQLFDSLKEKFKGFTDSIGLTNFAAEEAIQKQEQLINVLNRELALMEARGESEAALFQKRLEIAKQEEILANQKLAMLKQGEEGYTDAEKSALDVSNNILIIQENENARLKALNDEKLKAQADFNQQQFKLQQEEYLANKQQLKELEELIRQYQLDRFKIEEEGFVNIRGKRTLNNLLLTNDLKAQFSIEASELRIQKEKDLQFLEEIFLKELISREQYQQRKAQIDKYYQAQEEQRQNDIKIARLNEAQEIANSTLSIYGDLYEALSSTQAQESKKYFKAQQNLAIATSIVDTYFAANKAYLSQIIPGDPTSIIRAQIAAGVAIAQGLARIAVIRKQKYNPQSSPSAPGSLGNSNSGSGLINVPTTRLPQSQDILTQERRVYVLEGDITRTQRRAATNQNVSVLGG